MTRLLIVRTRANITVPATLGYMTTSWQLLRLGITKLGSSQLIARVPPGLSTLIAFNYIRIEKYTMLFSLCRSQLLRDITVDVHIDICACLDKYRGPHRMALHQLLFINLKFTRENESFCNYLYCSRSGCKCCLFGRHCSILVLQLPSSGLVFHFRLTATSGSISPRFW